MTDAVPWVKWRFDRWRGDEGLRMCGLAARGLWADLLAIMHSGKPYGHLAVNGRAPSPKQIASMVGMTTEREVAMLLNELEENGVFSRSDDGLIYCRRMVRDNAAREEAKLDGGRGNRGGNPNLARGTVPKDQRVRPFKRSDAPGKTGRIFDRDDGCCHWCGVELQRDTPGRDFFQVDHVIAVRDGGTNDEENLVASCADCNHKRARKERSEANPTPTTDTNQTQSDTNPRERDEIREREPEGEGDPSLRSGRARRSKKPQVAVPQDWRPNPGGIGYARERGVNVNIETQSFINRNTAVGKTYSDLDAAWRVWCDHAVQFGRAPGKSVPLLSGIGASRTLAPDYVPTPVSNGFD